MDGRIYGYKWCLLYRPKCKIQIMRNNQPAIFAISVHLLAQQLTRIVVLWVLFTFPLLGLYPLVSFPDSSQNEASYTSSDLRKSANLHAQQSASYHAQQSTNVPVQPFTMDSNILALERDWWKPHSLKKRTLLRLKHCISSGRVSIWSCRNRETSSYLREIPRRRDIPARKRDKIIPLKFIHIILWRSN